MLEPKVGDRVLVDMGASKARPGEVVEVDHKAGQFPYLVRFDTYTVNTPDGWQSEVWVSHANIIRFL